MVHSRKWCGHVEKVEGSKVIGVDKAGHWLMIDQPDAVIEPMVAWLTTPTGSQPVPAMPAGKAPAGGL
jgi:pimeloyl-ACP methyl ester carboxylesterase